VLGVPHLSHKNGASPLWSPVTLFVPEVSFLKEVSQKSFVFEFRSCIFEGSLAEKLRFRASKFHFWRKSRRKVWFLSFEASFLKEVSQKSLVFEFRSFIFEGSLAEKLRLRASKLHGFYLSIYVSIYLPTYLSYLILSYLILSIYLSFFLSYLSLSLSIYLSLSFYLVISLSLYLIWAASGTQGGGSLNKEVKWRQWFSGT